GVRILHTKGGPFLLAVDALDDGAAADANRPVGTTFGLWRPRPDARGSTLETAIAGGYLELVLGGYAMYGLSTILGLTAGDGVQVFALDELLGDFLLSEPKLRARPLSPRAARPGRDLVAGIHRSLREGEPFAAEGPLLSGIAPLAFVVEQAGGKASTG